MEDRRTETRTLCADLLNMEWRDGDSLRRTNAAALEDISANGACLQLDQPVPVGAECRISHDDWVVDGIVAYCIFRDIGYYVGITFEKGVGWTRSDFRPRHLLDFGEPLR